MELSPWKRHEPTKFTLMVQTADQTFYNYARFDTYNDALRAANDRAQKFRTRACKIMKGQTLLATVKWDANLTAVTVLEPLKV